MDLEKYRKIFTQESGKYLEQIDQLLIQVDNHPSDTGLWSDLHGKMHSIKGMARAMSRTNHRPTLPCDGKLVSGISKQCCNSRAIRNSDDV